MSTNTTATISAWGNGLALRLTKPMAKAAGVVDGTPVRVSVEPGRIVIETQLEPGLDDMLAAFDPARHGGELMAFAPIGAEVL
jgi:antitoxin MazE